MNTSTGRPKRSLLHLKGKSYLCNVTRGNSEDLGLKQTRRNLFRFCLNKSPDGLKSCEYRSSGDWLWMQ